MNAQNECEPSKHEPSKHEPSKHEPSKSNAEGGTFSMSSAIRPSKNCEPSIVCVGNRRYDAVACGMRLDRRWDRGGSPGSDWRRATSERPGILARNHVSVVRRPPAASCRTAGIVQYPGGGM